MVVLDLSADLINSGFSGVHLHLRRWCFLFILIIALLLSCRWCRGLLFIAEELLYLLAPALPKNVLILLVFLK